MKPHDIKRVFMLCARRKTIKKDRDKKSSNNEARRGAACVKLRVKIKLKKGSITRLDRT